jgi:glycosyltransferase involved in cell wall biosynthesis
MRLGLLPGGLAGSGGPSTYVTGFVRALPQVRPDVEVRTLLLGAKQARWRAREERHRIAETLGDDGVVPVLGRPVPAAVTLYNSRLAPLLPSYDRLFGRHDVYHQTHLDLDPAVPGDRLVLTLHDLVAEHWPDEGRLLPGAAHLLTRAAAVITVSARSREDILARFPTVSPERVHVVWNGVDHDLFHAQLDEEDARRLTAVGVGSPFLLYAGGLTRRKNVQTLLQAHDLLRREGQVIPPLVLVGPWDKGRLAGHARAGAVLPLGTVPRETVAALMRRADAVVLPSREEGFGLPALEAQACGALVICSDIPAFREVGGSAPIYVESADPAVLAAGIRAGLRITRQQRQQRRAEGLRHATGFSWQASAAGHAGVYEQVLQCIGRKVNAGGGRRSRTGARKTHRRDAG